MKEFLPLVFDHVLCKQEVDELGRLLLANESLSEAEQIQPFFEHRRQLSAFIASYVLGVGLPDRLSYKLSIFGDFATDIAIGSTERNAFCLVEFEDAQADSIFQKTDRYMSEWGRRFEHGFSQMVDWFRLLDDTKNNERFRQVFGYEHPTFVGMLILGRTRGLTDNDRSRLRWRTDHVLIDSHKIYCLTFDDLYQDLSKRIALYSDSAAGETS